MDLAYNFPGSSQVVFSNLSLTINPGELIVLKGKSGVGKSTLMDLILGQRIATAGCIKLNGRALEDYGDSISGEIAFVPQKTSIMQGSLAENVSFSRNQTNSERVKIQKALDSAGLSDFYRSLSEGIDTEISQDFRDLSGGQAQRLSLARALYSDAKILVLDEITSGLDAVTEIRILETVRDLKGKKSIVFITHKPAASEISDRVVELTRKGFI